MQSDPINDQTSSLDDTIEVSARPINKSIAAYDPRIAELNDNASDTNNLNPNIPKANTGDMTSATKKTNKSFSLGQSWQNFRSFTKKHSKAIKTIFLIGVVLILAGVSAVSVWAVNIWNNQSSLADLGRLPAQSSVVYASDGKTELFRFFEEENREPVKLDEISPNMQEAIIALEDENFWYNDSGIPWRNIAGATVQCAISVGDNCRGGSGLSQQLIKNVRKDDESSIQRKVRELFTAIKLNQTTTKPEILEDYLNWVPFGRNAYGIKQASKTYFNKDPKDLNPAESCYLASMVQRPSYFSSGISNPESNAWKTLQDRKDACLRKMFEIDLNPEKQGKPINSEAELLDLQKMEVTFQARGKNQKYSHFRDYITNELEKFIDPQDLFTGGYKIITTLDAQAQEEAEKIMSEARVKKLIQLEAITAQCLFWTGQQVELWPWLVQWITLTPPFKVKLM
ncbi:MAG: hypothetical protein OHK0017_12220 [Patescibacteria group bacterium]